MRSGEEEDDSGESSVETETDQTKPVNHHGGKLPVIDHQLLLVLLSQSACHRPQLLQDHLHLGREEGDEGGAGDVVPVAAAAVRLRLCHPPGERQHFLHWPESHPNVQRKAAIINKVFIISHSTGKRGTWKQFYLF